MEGSGSLWAMVFFCSLCLSLVLVPMTRRISLRLGALDRPDLRKIHDREVPRMGGLGIAAALLFSLAFLLPVSRGVLAFGAGLLLVVAFGFLDDLKPLPPKLKFSGQVLAALVFVLLGGHTIDSLGDLFGRGEIGVGRLSVPFTVFCMVGMMNALNLSDGLDGLAGGISLIAVSFLGIFAFQQGNVEVLVILFALGGSLLGFLRYNTYPAALFMGDSGSMLLGYTISVAVVRMLGTDAEVELFPVTLTAVVALPILDMVRVMGGRAARGKNPFHPDRSHLHHRLIELGLSQSLVVSILYVSMAAFGFLAWGLRKEPENSQLMAIFIMGGVLYAAVWVAGRSGGLSRKIRDGIRERQIGEARDHRLWKGLERGHRGMKWFLGIGLLPPVFFSAAVPKAAGVTALAVAGFLALLFPWRGNRDSLRVCHSLLFAASACLIGIVHILGTDSWVPAYLMSYSTALFAWVLLALHLRHRNRRLLWISGFETLLIGLMLFVATVVVPALGLEGRIGNAVILAGLESVPVLMALKLFVRSQPRRNVSLAAGLVFFLLVLGIRGFQLQDSIRVFPISSGEIRTVAR